MLQHESEFHYFLRLSNIPLYVYTTFCLFICRWTFGCFYLFAVVILLWTLVYTYLLRSLLSLHLGIYPEVELLDHMVILCWIFEELRHRFLQQLQHFTLLPAQGFQFLHILTSTLVIFCVFDNSHPNECEVVSHCGFDLYFSND